MTKFNWNKDNNAGWQAEMPNNVTLVVTPDRYARGFTLKAARGAKWHASASHWDESTRTMSRFGRDIYSILFNDAKSAMKAAEGLYWETMGRA